MITENKRPATSCSNRIGRPFDNPENTTNDTISNLPLSQGEHCQEGHEPLKESNEESPWSFEDAEFTLKKVNYDAGSTTSKGVIGLAEDILNHNNFSDLEMDAIKSLIKQYLRINKGALDKVIKAVHQENDDDTPELTHSDIADCFIEQHLPEQPKVVGAEGYLWGYNDTSRLYIKCPLTKIEAKVGSNFSGKNCQKGSDYKAIARLVYIKLACEGYFSEAPYGVAAKSYFIRIADDLSLISESYTPGHRQRHKLPADPERRDAPLFTQYLKDTFAGDHFKQQVALLQQIMGGLVTGVFSKLQRAVLLIGTGSNGKSVLLELLEHIFPPGLKAAVPPDVFDQEYYRAMLAGKIINIVGELDKTKSLKSVFKDIIGCDTPLSARIPYKAPFTYKPTAAHIFASNHFPQTKDYTHGFYRRWVILCFKNTVPDSKKIPNLGAKIAAEELPQVLYWALQGAEKLTQNKFILPFTRSHETELEKWKNMKDSVFCFLGDDDVVEHATGSKTPKKYAFAAYRSWCEQMGIKAVGYHEFLNRCDLKFREVKPSGGERCFAGMKLTGLTDGVTH
jgi:P4 family phage/plasmid primase-like protien